MEQSYKEKYEQAIERLKQWDREHPSGFVLSDRDKFIFPELAESEDEKMRKAIKEALSSKQAEDIIESKYKIKMVDVSVWLEKQCEHANFRNKIQVGDKVTRNEDGVLVNLSQLERVAKPRKKQVEQEKDILEDAILDGNEDGLIAETIRYKNKKQGEKHPDPYNGISFEYNGHIWGMCARDNGVDILLDKQLFKHLEKQDEQKEINLVEILKHYPKETELYSPLYGKLWLAEVDEKNEIITCYKHHLEEGCTRAVLEQEDTVSFYSNGTTGLPDFNVSKDCMLFLYDIEKQGEQKASYTTIVETGDGGINALVTRELPTEMKSAEESLGVDSNTYNKIVDECIFGEQKPEENKGNIGGISANWSEEDKQHIRTIIHAIHGAGNITPIDGELAEDWLQSLKDRVQTQPKQEWSEEDEKIINGLIDSLTRISINTRTDSTSPNFSFYKEIDWLKSLRP